MEPAWNGRFTWVALVALFALVAGCKPTAPPPAGAGGATGPSGTADVAAVPAPGTGDAPSATAAGASGASGPGVTPPAGATATTPAQPAPAPLPVTSAVARVPGASVSLASNAPSSVEPSSAFEIHVGAPLRGARLVLLDAQDALVPSVSDIEVGTETVITLVPDDVLRPGSTYLLRLEGLTGRLLASDGGKTFEPAAFPLQTTGTAPPKVAPKKSSKRRRGG